MTHDPIRRHVQKASTAVQHLGRAVRGARAFYVLRDRNDPGQPQVIACHPPLSHDDLLRTVGGAHVVCHPIAGHASHEAFVGIGCDGGFENAELATEMAAVAAESLTFDLAPDAPFDPITGLPDRTAFLALLEHQRGGTAPDTECAVLVVDLDHFHRVVAGFGDSGGEELMRLVARRLEDALGPDTPLTRLGGDRFGVLVASARPERCADVAESLASRVHALLRAPVSLRDEAIFVTASIGAAFAAPDTVPTRVLHDAEIALALAKRAGGATTRVFRAGSDNAPAIQLLRERDVRLAVNRREFTVHFQPIFGADSSQLHAFEALLRWNNPQEGLLPPAMFLDVLHETGLIDEVGRSVIEDACDHGARWLALSGALVPVSVNVAALQLYADDFADHIAATLARAGLPGRGLILELTEHAIIEDRARVRRALQAVRDLGVRVLIDDFGTGYSSLSYLHELPVSGIKLDRQWFRGIDSSPRQREVVRAIVSLAHGMDMDVVAEGIETAAQLRAARDLQCDFAQGFCLSHPFDAEHATRFLARTLRQEAIA